MTEKYWLKFNECWLCSRYCDKPFTCIMSCNINIVWKVLSLLPFYQWEYWCSETLSFWPNITQPGNGGNINRIKVHLPINLWLLVTIFIHRCRFVLGIMSNSNKPEFFANPLFWFLVPTSPDSKCKEPWSRAKLSLELGRWLQCTMVSWPGNS